MKNDVEVLKVCSFKNKNIWIRSWTRLDRIDGFVLIKKKKTVDGSILFFLKRVIRITWDFFLPKRDKWSIWMFTPLNMEEQNGIKKRHKRTCLGQPELVW